MKNIFILFTLFFSFFCFFVEAKPDQVNFRSYPPQLQNVVQKLLTLPEAKELLQRINKEGSVAITLEGSFTEKFDAKWDGTFRTIMLNPYRHTSEGSMICSILFEMHNAAAMQYLNHLFSLVEHNLISKEEWVEKVERLEHRNALTASQLLKKGISLGVYPASADWNIYENFDDHYKLQQLVGHSYQLAVAYDQLNKRSNRQKYIGTIPNRDQMSSEAIQKFINYLAFKNKST